MAVDTHSFHGPAFYRQYGFEAIGEMPGYPAGHSYVLMRKLLDSGLHPTAAASYEFQLFPRVSSVIRMVPALISALIMWKLLGPVLK